MSSTSETPQRVTLRELPLAARLTISLFLISVGIGYTSALVQLHFAQAKPGNLLPDMEDAAHNFHGMPGVGTFERLIRADEHRPFNGSGSMRAAFFKRSAGWSPAIGRRSRDFKINTDQAERELRKEREAEIDAILHWLKEGATEKTYADQILPDDFPKAVVRDLPGNTVNAHVTILLQNQPIAAAACSSYFVTVPKPLENEFFEFDENGKYHSHVKKIIDDKCARCHAEGKGGPQGKIHLESWQEVVDWVHDMGAGGSNGMSLMKLAQTTHVHLLGFAMLYGLTGLILAFSSYPGWLRLILCPLPLTVQIVDISCWWLGRLDPMYAHFVVVTGGVVAMGLMLHIILSLLNMYGVAGKIVLLLMFAAAGGGGFVVKTQLVDPYLARERSTLAVPAPVPEKK